MQNNITFVVLGGTGDLSKRKIVPAIYNMFRNNKIQNFAVVLVSRTKTDKTGLLDESKRFIANFDIIKWNEFNNKTYTISSDFNNENFCDIGLSIRTIEKSHNLEGNRIFYLATLPDHFETIARKLKECGLTENTKKRYSRIVFEKPFGNDLPSAKKLDRSIKKYFSEKQIFRIDHYLGKELIQNLLIARFTNTILEPIWNNKYIDHIQIILSEDVGVEGRGTFYDKYGAIKDVMQNHMMQMLALTTMEPPSILDSEKIRDKKVEILKKVRASKELVIGQYEGYLNEAGVNKDSKTETLSATKVFIDNKRWKGVPFYLLTGKKLKDKITSIYIQFKHPICRLYKNQCVYNPNYLLIQIQPNEGLFLQINAKKAGINEITNIHLEFCHKCIFGANTPEAYENLLIDVVNADQSAFIRTDEIETQWKIYEKLSKQKRKIEVYNNTLPKGADELIKKEKRAWHLNVKQNWTKDS